ncbi:MAG: hypothetical protein JW795_14165 [Chitinivibrionales bacterium]|nr:hypothetical protein [Chitinivibrionales bacterium]
MRKSTNFVCLFLIISVTITMAIFVGCAVNKHNTADAMRVHATKSQDNADLKNQIAKDWEKGQKLVKSGTKNVEKGGKIVQSAQQDLDMGNSQIDLGNKEIAEGNNLMQNSEKRFREVFPELELMGRHGSDTTMQQQLPSDEN